MAWTFVGAGTKGESNGNSVVAGAAHASTTTDDVVLYLVVQASTGTVTCSDATAKSLKIQDNAVRIHVELFALRYGGAPPPTFTSSALAAFIVRPYTFRGGVLDFTTITAHVTSADDGAPDFEVEYPGLTITTANTLALIVYGVLDNESSDDTPAGFTDGGLFNTALGADCAGNLKYQIQTTATNVTTGIITFAGGGVATANSIVISLKPLTSGTSLSVNPGLLTLLGRSKAFDLTTPWQAGVLALRGLAKSFIGGTVPITVPSVLGANITEAGNALEALGLMLALTYQASASIDKDSVITQSPAAGTIVAYGATVSLTVSLGGVTVPQLAGLSQAAAIAAILNLGLVVGTITTANDSVASGLVLTQSPAAGTVVIKDTEVDISVSLGPLPLAEAPILKPHPTRGLRKFLLG